LNKVDQHADQTVGLLVTFPEYEWLPWKFGRASSGYWDDIQNQRKFFDWIAKKMKVTEFSDWQKVTTNDIKENGGSAILTRYNSSLHTALAAIYPEQKLQPWISKRVPSGYNSSVIR
jgi:hypothetical protein